MKQQTKMSLFGWSLPVLACFALAPIASAVTINFSVHNTADTSVNSTTIAGPNGVAVGAETWNLNNFTGTPQSGLLDSTATATGVGVSFTNFGGVDDWGINSPLKLLWRSARNFDTSPGNAASFAISGLTVGTGYDLWIATSHVNGTIVGDWATSNTNTTGATVVINNTGFEGTNSTWVAGVNYVLFNGIQPDNSGNITMTVHSISGAGERLGFNGFQLVTAVPEPSAALLGGIGLIGLLRRRRG